MELMRIAGFSAAAAVTALTVRRLRPEMGPVLALAAGAALLGMASPAIGQLMGGIADFSRGSGVPDQTIATLLKITGISLLMEFAARTCRDAGEDGVAAHAELAGRVMILGLALPFMQQLMGLVLSVAI